jgi:hypothetical protein
MEGVPLALASSSSSLASKRVLAGREGVLYQTQGNVATGGDVVLKSSEPAELECDGVNGVPCMPTKLWGNCWVPWK